MFDLPLERTGRLEIDARHVREAIVLAIRPSLEEAADLSSGTERNERDLPEMPRANACGENLSRGGRVVQATNTKIAEAKALMTELRQEGLLTDDPFDEPIEFIYFDLWHYYGRTAKHGALWVAQTSCSGMETTNCS